jgi:hypothetical protein
MVKTAVIDPFAGGVTEAGLRLHPTETLLVEQVRATAELYPFNEVTVTVEFVEFPANVVNEAGVRVSEKS